MWGAHVAPTHDIYSVIRFLVCCVVCFHFFSSSPIRFAFKFCVAIHWTTFFLQFICIGRLFSNNDEVESLTRVDLSFIPTPFEMECEDRRHNRLHFSFKATRTLFFSRIWKLDCNGFCEIQFFFNYLYFNVFRNCF